MENIFEELFGKCEYKTTDILVNSEKIIIYLQTTIAEKESICTDNLFIYRLEALMRVISSKNKLLEQKRKNLGSSSSDEILKLELVIKKYSDRAILLMQEIYRNCSINNHSIN